MIVFMNQLFRDPDLRSADLPMTTQAAEGLARRRWSVAEIEALTRAGVLDEGERFELIGGEIVPMNPKGIRHEVLKNALIYHFVRNAPAEFVFAGETTFRLSDDSFVEPDFVFFRKADGLAALNPKTALLAVEVADSSLRWDLGRKALLYAHCGIPELWVIDAVAETTHVHTEPGLEGYRSIRQVPAAETVACAVIPGLSMSLAALERF
jgi:Uma2 family endonuclease